MADFTSYQPPGVYVEEISSPVASLTGVAPAVVAIVGPSIGYRTYTEVVTLTGTTAASLSKLGIDSSSVVVTSLTGTAYTVTTDYTLTEGPGADADAGDTLDNTMTITREAGGSITSGEQVKVSYQYTDASYYDPIRVRDYEDVKDAYGAPFDSAGAIVSPLSLAAKLAFDNGALELVLLSTLGDASAVTRTQISDQYPKLEALTDVGVVVPLGVGIAGTEGSPGDVITTATDLATHVGNASDQENFRIGIYGVDTTDAVNPDTLAAGIADKRVATVYPRTLLYYDGPNNQTIEVSGYYLAAAIGGLIASQQAQEPITRKPVRGFSGLPSSTVETLTKSNMNTWSEAGVTVVHFDRSRRLIVRHGTTTDPSSVQTREISMVRAKDALITLLQRSVDSANLIGSTIDEDTPYVAKGVVQGVLEVAVQSGLIVSYADLAARVAPGNPQVVEVKFMYRPAYPLNYILISFQIDTSTGIVFETAGSTA